MKRLREDEGSAVVEFVGLSVVLLIPLVYLVLSLAHLQAASFAADTVARNIARITSTTPDAQRRLALNQALVRNVSEDYGVHIDLADVNTRCSSKACPQAGALVTTTVTVEVNLPGLGPLFEGAGLMTVTSTHAMRADGSLGVTRP